MSLPQVGSLLALLLFVYSVVGVQLFTFLSHTHDDDFVTKHTKRDGINDERNFETIGSAALLLFQVAI